MASTLQIVRRYDTSVVLFDLNDPTGVNSADYGGVLTDLIANPDFGAVPWQPVRHEPPGITGGLTTFNRAGLSTMFLPVRIRGTSYDNLTTAVGRLGELLAAGGTMKWVADGSTKTRFIDFEPSMAPALVDGRELALPLAMGRFDTPDGVVLSITRQPYFRGSQLNPDDNLLTNATLLRDQDANGRPDDYSWSSTANITNESISATGEAYQFDLAVGTTRQLHQTTGSSTVAATEVWTMSGYARATVGTSAEVQAMIEFQTNAGAVINTATGTLIPLTTVWKRITVTGTAGGTTGRAQVGLRMDNTDAVSNTIQFRNWQFERSATATDFRVRSAVVSMTPTATGMARVMPIYNPSASPAPCEFTITAPDSGSDLTDIYMALRSSRQVQGDRFLADYLNGPFYAPADSTGNGWTVVLGTNVTDGGTFADINHATSPTVYSKKITWTRTTKLDCLRGEHDVWARIEAQGAVKYFLQLRWGPNGGATAPYTLQEVTFDSTAGGSGSVMVNLGRIRLPLDTAVTLGTLTLELWTHTDGFDQDLEVHNLFFVPAEEQAHLESSIAVVQNEKIRTDPGSRPGRYAVEKLSSANALTLDMPASDVPFTVPPGLSLVYFEVLDQPVPFFVEPESVDNRTVSVSPVIHPRYPG